jgi:hypothetical protein
MHLFSVNFCIWFQIGVTIYLSIIHIRIHFIVLETYNIKHIMLKCLFLLCIILTLLWKTLYVWMYTWSILWQWNMSVIPKISHYFGYRYFRLNRMYDMRKIMYIHKYIYMYIYMYIHIYTYTHIGLYNIGM